MQLAGTKGLFEIISTIWQIKAYKRKEGSYEILQKGEAASKNPKCRRREKCHCTAECHARWKNRCMQIGEKGALRNSETYRLLDVPEMRVEDGDEALVDQGSENESREDDEIAIRETRKLVKHS